MNKMAFKLVKKTDEKIENKIFDSLNDSQKEAVETTDGPLLIVAGAGSGKTRVLTYKIAYLIQQNVNPYNILALTFTNKAANEMKERISKLVAPDAAQKIWAGTFHSIFAKILRYDVDKIGFSKSFSIYDTDDSLGAIKQVMNNLNISNQANSPQAIRSKISWSKNQLITWQQYSSLAREMTENVTAKVYESYENFLRQNNAMDFDDLLVNLIYLFRNSNETMDKWQSRFKYILVDEYQDTNRAQYIAIQMLAEKFKNISVVGDDAQSIYRWRGADIRNILDFQKDYPDSKIIRLEKNYRSTKTILSAAGSLISHNRNQIQKTLWTDNKEGDLIEVLICKDDREESTKIVDIIKEKSKGKEYTYSDFAVLYRTNAQSLSLENSLRKENIPYVIIGGISFYKRKEIKDVIAYLKLLINTQDSEALLRAVNEPPRGIGQTSINHLQNFANNNSISLYEAFINAGQVKELQTRAINSIDSFISFIEKYRSQIVTNNDTNVIIEYINSTSILDMYREMNTEDSNDRLNNIQQLISDIADYFNREKNSTLDEYLQQVTLLTDIDTKDTSNELVKLMTLHSAKGLEFPVVFIAGLEQGLFPLIRTELSKDEEEEERRLFYVGITRAEQKLYLSQCKNRLRYGSVTIQKPSMFLNEIDPKCLKWRNHSIKPSSVEKNIKTNATTTFFKEIIPEDNYSQIVEEGFNFVVGDRVKHSHFGMGKIIGLSGNGVNSQALVNFENVGRKRLMLQYAKLEKTKL